MSQANLNGNAARPPAPPASPATAATIASGSVVRGAIARASSATGVDFSYLLAQARLESSLDPQARATTSSAAGLYQFTKGTWAAMLARHGAALGASGGPASASPAGLMALRYDPNAAAMMAAELAGDNTTALTAVLARSPSSSELYLAHFLGATGATRFLGALSADPGQSAAALLPKAAAANPGIFFDASGAALSVRAVMSLVQTKMDAALQNGAEEAANADSGAMAGDFGTMSDLGGLGPPPLTSNGPGPIADQDDEAQAAADPGALTRGTTMSATLNNTFGLGGEASDAGAAPGFVRSAYGAMQAFGL